MRYKKTRKAGIDTFDAQTLIVAQKSKKLLKSGIDVPTRLLIFRKMFTQENFIPDPLFINFHSMSTPDLGLGWQFYLSWVAILFVLGGIMCVLFGMLFVLT